MKRRRIHVKLIGELGRKFGRSYSFIANSPKEVLSALSNQIEGFVDYLNEAHERGIGFRLVTKDAAGIGYEETVMPCDQLVMAPIVTGAGNSFGQILVGVALVALAFIPFGQAGAFAGLASAAAAKGAVVGSALLFSLGASLILTGIAGLLTPPVENPTGDSRKKDSFLFDRAAELTTQGYPVPLLYGRFLAAAPLVISSSISTTTVPV